MPKEDLSYKEEAKRRFEKLKTLAKTKTKSKGKTPKANVQAGIKSLLKTI